MKIPTPGETVRAFAEVFAQNGFSLYLVGGAVRDCCLGRRNGDFDFTTDALPSDVQRIFRRVIPTGIKHGTVTVLFRGGQFEVTTFRSETGYSDSRHPDRVEFVSSLEEDLKRRDFTINALAVRLPGNEVLDYHHGLDDLKTGLIRCIGVPDERFFEDALRMLRACRFSAVLDFSIEQETLRAVSRLSQNITLVSTERIADELSKTLMADYPCKGLEYMRTTGLLKLILPELQECFGVQQLGFHHEDVYGHCLSTLQLAADARWPLELRMACLLHDIAKPLCRSASAQDGHYTFYNHDAKGAQITRSILRRLKFSNAFTDKVCALVANHMFNYSSDWTDGAIRRFISRCGKDNIQDVLLLRLADMRAITPDADPTPVAELKQRIDGMQQPVLTVNDLALSGRDLTGLGLKPGPLYSEIKNFLLQQVLDRPELNNREALLEITRKYLENRNE